MSTPLRHHTATRPLLPVMMLAVALGGPSTGCAHRGRQPPTPPDERPTAADAAGVAAAVDGHGGRRSSCLPSAADIDRRTIAVAEQMLDRIQSIARSLEARAT